MEPPEVVTKSSEVSKNAKPKKVPPVVVPKSIESVKTSPLKANLTKTKTDAPPGASVFQIQISPKLFITNTHSVSVTLDSSVAVITTLADSVSSPPMFFAII